MKELLYWLYYLILLKYINTKKLINPSFILLLFVVHLKLKELKSYKKKLFE